MMGRSPCSDDEKGLKKGPWTAEEDNKLVEYIQKHGHGSWRALPKLAGLNRCGKSCRLRWTNYLRPDIKRGKFSDEEEQIIINLHSVLGNKWSVIASNLEGRTDNEIKNYWNTHLRKKLMNMGIDPVTHGPRTDHHHHLNLLAYHLPQLLAAANLSNLMMNNPDAAATQLAKVQLLQNLLQALSSSTSTPLPPNMDAISNYFGTTTSPLFQDFRPFERLRAINNSHHHYHLLNELVNGQVNFSQDYSQMAPLNFPNLDNSSQQLDLGNSCVIAPNTNQILPPLVSFLPELFKQQSCFEKLGRDNSSFTELAETKMLTGHHHSQPSPTHGISNPSSTSTTIIEGWGDQLVDDEASDSYWKDIIDQASSLPWTPTL